MSVGRRAQLVQTAAIGMALYCYCLAAAKFRIPATWRHAETKMKNKNKKSYECACVCVCVMYMVGATLGVGRRLWWWWRRRQKGYGGLGDRSSIKIQFIQYLYKQIYYVNIPTRMKYILHMYIIDTG